MYLKRNQADDGSIAYLVSPDCKVVPGRNNAIRQWLATLALAEYAECTGKVEWIDVATKHRDYLIQAMLTEHEGLAALRLRDRSKLGTIAIACMALDALERQGHASDIVTSGELLSSILAMQEENGDFRTFLDPPDRNDQQFFYPGEALTCIAYVAPRLPSELQEKMRENSLRGIRRYRERWASGELRNPAFAPWHIQAVALHLASFETDAETREWMTGYAFELADFLVSFQQTTDAPSREDYGRFDEPLRPDCGPPHASSNGVYLVGRALAARLAHEVDAQERASQYHASISAGYKYLEQLQIQHPVSPLSHLCERATGGISNSRTDPHVRIDNAAHCLRFGVLMILNNQ